MIETTMPYYMLDTTGYWPGYGRTVDTHTGQLGDIVKYKLNPDGKAVCRWEAPSFMDEEYRGD